MNLKNRLIEMIETSGPLPVSTFMQMCLHDPAEGYYTTRPGLGSDFITAPEISQVFGELLGLWAAHEWQAIGAPSNLNFVEFGPGRGTLMADALRAAASTDLLSNAHIHLIEPSPALRKFQSEKLAAHAVRHADNLESVPIGHTLIIGNEYLDCLPVRQFAKSDGLWRERVIGLTPENDLAFGLTTDRAPDHPASEASAAELQPGLELLVESLKQRHEAGDVFRALFIDYGSVDGPPADTLRAYRNGTQIHPLVDPGTCDLTVDVDFQRLRSLAQKAGLSVNSAIPQGGFLMRLGVEARMQALIRIHPSRGDEIFEGVGRLVDPTEMGERFKVICISSPGLPTPAGF